jgi:hypothetical protein
MLPLYGYRFGLALLLYPFRFVDPVTGKWVRARYRAERHEIAARYVNWEITGEPELRRVAGNAFNPWR